MNFAAKKVIDLFENLKIKEKEFHTKNNWEIYLGLSKKTDWWDLLNLSKSTSDQYTRLSLTEYIGENSLRKTHLEIYLSQEEYKQNPIVREIEGKYLTKKERGLNRLGGASVLQGH